MANNFSRLIKNSHFAWQMILADGTIFPVGVLRTCPFPVFPPARCKKKRREIYWRGQTTSGRAKRKEGIPAKNQQAASQLLADSSRRFEKNSSRLAPNFLHPLSLPKHYGSRFVAQLSVVLSENKKESQLQFSIQLQRRLLVLCDSVRGWFWRVSRICKNSNVHLLS